MLLFERVKRFVLFLFISLNAFANVERPTEVVPDHLVLLGRGVERQKTKESIALACYPDSECEHVRFVYIDSQKNAHWIGSVFSFTADHPGVRRLEVKRYLKQRDQSKPLEVLADLDGDVSGIAYVLGIFVGIPLLNEYAINAGLATAPYILLVLSPVGTYLIIRAIVRAHQKQFVSTHTLGSLTLERGQSDWNWSQDPLRMKAKRFYKLLKIIQGDIGIYSNEQENALRRYERKIERIKERNGE